MVSCYFCGGPWYDIQKEAPAGTNRLPSRKPRIVGCESNESRAYTCPEQGFTSIPSIWQPTATGVDPKGRLIGLNLAKEGIWIVYRVERVTGLALYSA